MWTALHQEVRVEAWPGGHAQCPQCREPVLAKCGAIVSWHWAHESREDCDAWSEPDSEWHRAWQREVPIDNREIVLGPHRADIRTDTGVVVEIQHSSISVADIHQRTWFYGRSMIWIFDAVEAMNAGRLNLRSHDYGTSFRWKHPRKSVLACLPKSFLLDLGPTLLWVQKIHFETGEPTGGWGYLLQRREVVDGLNGRCALPRIPADRRPAQIVMEQVQEKWFDEAYQ